MTSLNELKAKIEKLQAERTELIDELKNLKQLANEKTQKLEQEITNLREDAEHIREILHVN